MSEDSGAEAPNSQEGERGPGLDPSSLLPALLRRRAEIADHWRRAIARTSFVPLGAGALRERLLTLTERLIRLLVADAPDHEAAQAVGAALVALHYTQPASLGRTQEALAERLTAGLPDGAVAALQPRLAALLGDVAVGFFEQARRAILAEQEAIRGALLRERRRAEEALRESEGRFRAIFEGSPMGIVVAGLDGRIVETNAALQRMLGYPGEEMQGQVFTAFSHPEDLKATWALHRELMLGQRDQYESEQRFQRKEGGTVWGRVTVVILRDAEGQARYVLAMGENITERKRAEAALAEQYRAADAARSQTRAILDATGEAMLLIAPDGRILAANRRFGELFPIPGPLPGRPFAAVRAAFARILGEEGAASLAVHIPDSERRFTQDMAQRWPDRRDLELSSAPVPDERGRPLGRLFAFRDVTRERAVDRMKSEFVALVSHELRTPLTSIKGYVDLLLAGEVGALAAEQREFLAIVGHNSDRLVAMIGELLDLSRIDAGRVELARAPLDLGRLLADLAASFRPQIEGKAQRLATELAPDLPAVWGDADRVTQILTNLIANAHQYTPAGGAITVSARPAGEMVQIAVRDTGVGMTAEEQAQLFTRFFRARNRATLGASGTGLGLAITRSLVELHGGRIAVASAPGQGSTFTVTLPATEAARPAEQAPPPAARPGGRVLVVDDEPEIAALLRRYLERAGYAVAVAHGAREALRRARAEPPDLITLDVRMPDADGYAALEWLKGDPATVRIPVVLVSVAEDSGRGRLLGAADYVAKPVEEAVLLARVAAALTGETRRRVLVADDDADARQLLAHLLRRRGYAVLEAADGAEAVALIRARRPDLALLDVRMPGTDGLAALAALRADPATRALPVLLLTASPGALEGARPAAARLGVTRLIAKPERAEELAAAVAAALDAGGRT